jgi:hypothetical protein
VSLANEFPQVDLDYLACVQAHFPDDVASAQTWLASQKLVAFCPCAMPSSGEALDGWGRLLVLGQAVGVAGGGALDRFTELHLCVFCELLGWAGFLFCVYVCDVCCCMLCCVGNHLKRCMV